MNSAVSVRAGLQPIGKFLPAVISGILSAREKPSEPSSDAGSEPTSPRVSTRQTALTARENVAARQAAKAIRRAS